jgi:hypothetical protein
LVPARAHTFLLRGFQTQKNKNQKSFKKREILIPLPEAGLPATFPTRKEKRRGSNWPTLIAPRLLCPDPVLILKPKKKMETKYISGCYATWWIVLRHAHIQTVDTFLISFGS